MKISKEDLEALDKRANTVKIGMIVSGVAIVFMLVIMLTDFAQRYIGV